MRAIRAYVGTALLALVVLLLLVTFSMANGPGYTLTRWRVAGGGGENSSGGYTLRGTVGQAEAGVLSGGGYDLGGGFWHGAGWSAFDVYLPVAVRGQ